MSVKRNSYFDGWEKAIHATNAKLTAEQERLVLQAFQSNMEDLIAKISRARDGYLPIKIYKDFAYNLYVVLNKISNQYTKKVVEETIDAQMLFVLQLLGGEGNATAGLYAKNVRIASSVYSTKVAELIARGGIYKDGKGLSQRIWKISNAAGKTVQQVVQQGISSGQSAAQMAQLLEQFVKPKARRNWDVNKIEQILGKTYARNFQNLEYNALRMARTTISHAATASVRQWGKINPYAKKVQWHSVHAPGRTCQICIDLDGQVFPIEECPFDHPNGLCYQTVYYDRDLESIADELKDWVDGKPNERLDEWCSQLNLQ